MGSVLEKIRRLPTFLALSILFFGTIGGVVLIQQGPSLILRASSEIIPRQVRTTNISDQGLTISWVTNVATVGALRYGPDSSLAMSAKDDRDQLSGRREKFFTHHVTLRGLKPAATYYFKIVSNETAFDNNGQLYQFRTAPVIRQPLPSNDVAYGVVVHPDGSPAEGVIVYLSLANSVPLSTLTKSSGNWALPISFARSEDLASYVSYDREASVEEIFVQGEVNQTATAVVTTKDDSPLPKIILGQNFDFRKAGAVGFPSLSPVSEGRSVSLLESRSGLSGQAADSQGEVEIVNPDSGERINTSRPEIFGRGPAGAVLSINVQSLTSYSGVIRVNARGEWFWTPPADLEPGVHTLTVSYLDQEISRTFTVLAADEEEEWPAFTATPSGTITLSPSPSPTLSLTPALSPTVTPTLVLEVTLTPTLSPTATPTPPVTGVLTPTLWVFIMGIVLVLLGSLAIIF